MSVVSPFVSSAPGVRSPATVPSYQLRSGDGYLTIFPFKFVVTSGAISSHRGGERLFIEDQGSQVYRIYHPKCDPAKLSLYVTFGQSSSLTIDKSNAASGYTDITAGASITDTFQGVLGIKFGRAPQGSFENSFDSVGSGGTLRSRGLKQVFGGTPDLAVFMVRFDVDGSSDVTSSTVESALPCFPEHTGVGEWSVHLPLDFRSGEWMFFAENDGGPQVAYKGSGNGEVVIEDGGGADQNNSSFTLIGIGATGNRGIDAMGVVNTIPPAHSTKGFPVKCYAPEASLFLFNVDIDAGEDILSTSVLTGGANFTGDGASDMSVDVGRSIADMSFGFIKDVADGAVVQADFSNLESNGLVYFSSFPAGATTFMGLVVSGTAIRR